MEILHHGAVDGITGSCYQLRLADDFSLLVDCGLFQSSEASSGQAAAERQDIDSI
tara:strand:+ start:573 stop:737 length:165 start_codon:yes stop_codon:yes gene_type:complete